MSAGSKVDLGVNWLRCGNGYTKISTLGANELVHSLAVLVDIDFGHNADKFQPGQRIRLKDSVALKDGEYEIHSVDKNRVSITASAFDDRSADLDLTDAGIACIGNQIGDFSVKIAKSGYDGRAKIEEYSFNIDYFGDNPDQFKLGQKLRVEGSTLLKDGEYEIITIGSNHVGVLVKGPHGLEEGEETDLTPAGVEAMHGPGVTDPDISIYTFPQSDTDLNLTKLSLTNPANHYDGVPEGSGGFGDFAGQGSNYDDGGSGSDNDNPF